MAKTATKIDLTPRLLEHTHNLLITRPRNLTIEQITETTGISSSWLAKFASGSVKDPSVNTVEQLYVYLSNKPLDL